MRAELNLAWAAGFYEGEGSIAASGHTLILTVPQVDREPLDRFSEIFPTGTLLWDARRGLHLYRAYGANAQHVAMSLWSNLTHRRQNQILRALIRHASRRVRDPQRCRRRHLYTEVGSYRRECVKCRDERRQGPLGPLPPLPTAFEARTGLREYVPPTIRTAREAVAWTFDVPADHYTPSTQT